MKTHKKIITLLEAKFDAEVKNNNLLQNGDNVLIGVSGGLDSLVLTYNLYRWKKYFLPNINLTAVYVNILNIPYEVNLKQLLIFLKKLQIPLIFVEKKISIDKKKLRSNPCFICSWNRRKILFNFTKDRKFNKIALGHNLDDAVETFLLNILYHGQISSLPSKLKMFEGRIDLIRPLISIEKQLIEQYAKVKNFNVSLKQCKYATQTKRTEVEEILSAMKKFQKNPKQKIFEAMRNISYEYLP